MINFHHVWNGIGDQKLVYIIDIGTKCCDILIGYILISKGDMDVKCCVLIS